MLGIFLQGMVLTFFHLDAQRHFFCAEHQQVTHDASHVDSASDDPGSEATEPAPSPDEPGEDDRSADPCEWLTWLNLQQNAQPAQAPDLLQSPVVDGPDVPVAVEETHHTPRIPLYRVAPTNSPPTA